MKKEIRKTAHGTFHQDYCGLWHYTYEECFGTVSQAAEDAVKNRPKGATWFWFNDTPAHIRPDDSAPTLVGRWELWRQDYQCDPKILWERLRGYVSDSRAGAIRA
ncbi:MAG: hypothetical protein HYT98_00170 [Candidatus Sungbacteria bacterium]|nr:hypothetical protein [Candidatus Sungbacteria bacterium]